MKKQAVTPKKVFVTGSTDGLGFAAARSLLNDGHEVVLHARTSERAAALAELRPRAAGVVIGDLRSAKETESVAQQVNAVGRMDAVIHNAGIYQTRGRDATPEGHASILAVNTLAPFILTARLQRPGRLIFVSSSEHRAGSGPLRDLDWTARPFDASRAYGESKLYVVALAFALARRWPDVLSNAVDPGWVRTRMGGPAAPVDIETGQRTQAWLAVSDAEEVRVSGKYWHQLQQQQPAREALDIAFQDSLIDELSGLTGLSIPECR
jgi:NAD(P)-dependent dehydrogenase (short-subunit alcohol dehydrogenase family)